jgi:1-deoxy-D-xylulose-5-phosphate synthase
MNHGHSTPLLDRIQSPHELRALEPAQLAELAGEIRAELIDLVCQTGGHLAPSLGVVELTLALHYLFDTPNDRLVWDVGHQAYAHKLLTGRRARMRTLRQQDGLSGFTKRDESEYDSFGAGHSSTSISAALGMAIAAQQQNDPKRCVAIIGDGALTGGMAFEALNHAGVTQANLLVVLNDNDMSISKNVGALSRYLGRILSSNTYTALRESSRRILKHVPGVWEFARRAEEHVKGMVVPGTLFEELGFQYLGPVDGHDLPALLKVLRTARDLPGPRLLHVITQKGRGFKPAEQDPSKYHGVAQIDPDNGETLSKSSSQPTYTQIFGDWLCAQAAVDPKLVAVTPAMGVGSGMVRFAEAFPQRFHDVGIAEQHATTFCGGLAAEGLKPVLAIYSTFLQRGYDQVIHDIALQNLDVTFAIDRAGLVGADGPTHHGSFDLSFLQCVPNLVIATPADAAECQGLLNTAYHYPGPAAVRYPRGASASSTPASDPYAALPLGKAELRRQGSKVCLLAFGAPLTAALEAAEELDATVLSMRFVKPLDREAVLEQARAHALLVTLEENALTGGAGTAVAACLQAAELTTPLMSLGIPDAFIPHGGADALLRSCGLDSSGIIRAVRSRLSGRQPG